MGNNNTIDGPSYYMLPCGRQLEDYMMQRNYPGPMWDAVAYRYRAGKKDGEPFAKDIRKVDHYCKLMTSWSELPEYWYWRRDVRHEVARAKRWDGKEQVAQWVSPLGAWCRDKVSSIPRNLLLNWSTSLISRNPVRLVVEKTLKFVRLDPRAKIPYYAHEGDSGMDICALEDGIVPAHGRLAVKTGIAAIIPEGYEIQVRPRSGLQFKHGVIGGFGTIDRGYTGDIGVLLINTTDAPFAVRAGDRVSQLVLAPVEHARIEEADRLPDTDRGDSGFGSTGLQ